METVFSALQVLTQTYAEVEQRFTGIDDLAHGWEHVGRVYKLAQYLAEREEADSFVVGMAALLHDLGRTAPHNANEHHADLSVTLAAELLNSYHVPIDKQQAILHAIIAHSFSRGVEPLTLEARIVRDADRLDGLGAIGIMRWAVTGAVRRTAQTKSYHPTDPFAETHKPDDHSYMLDHFFAKLFKLSETMATETGRALAQQRTDFMRTYLDEFRRELEL
ncbi:MAG: HD domain-containing protein [Chloroflexi bacterium]|nr:HD domain-containing protein [Chloroflexota bacterium]